MTKDLQYCVVSLYAGKINEVFGPFATWDEANTWCADQFIPNPMQLMIMFIEKRDML